MNIVVIIQHLPSGWHSVWYSFISGAFDLITGRMFLFSVFNFLAFIHLLITLLSILNLRWRSLTFFLLLLVLLLPPSISCVIYQNRDATYSILLVAFLLSFLQYRVNRHSTLLINPILLLILGCFLGELRHEGLLISLITLPMIYFFITKNRSVLKKYIVLYIGFAFSIQVLPFLLFGINPFNKDYALTGFVNPLTYILNRIDVTKLSPEVYKKIDAVMSVDKMLKYPDPYDIEPFYRNGARTPLQDEAFNEFKKTVRQLYLEHFGLFIENRLNLAKRMHNFDQDHVFQYPDVLKNFSEHDLAGNLSSQIKVFEPYFKTQKDSFPEKLVEGYLNIFPRMMPKLICILLISTLVPLCSLVFLFCNWKKTPYLATLSVILLVRTALFFVVAPAAYFKYVTSTWLGGWLLLVIYLNISKEPNWLLKIRQNRRQVASS